MYRHSSNTSRTRSRSDSKRFASGCRLPKSFSKTGRWASGVRAMDRNVPRTRSEGAIEAPESGSLRSAAEQGELLSERQVLEREVGAGPERRAQGAQERREALERDRAAGAVGEEVFRAPRAAGR